MATAATTSVRVYLRTAYRPDCDYVDGKVQERNVGEIPHGWLQRFFSLLFQQHVGDWQLYALPEVRVQVMTNRFRVPDVTVLPKQALGASIITVAPPLCIEIFSSDDRMSRMLERVADYQDMGVKAVWVIDPWRRMAYQAASQGKLEVVESLLTLPDTQVTVAVNEIF